MMLAKVPEYRPEQAGQPVTDSDKSQSRHQPQQQQAQRTDVHRSSRGIGQSQQRTSQEK